MPSLYNVLMAPKVQTQSATMKPVLEPRWQQPLPEVRVPETSLHRSYRLGAIGIDRFLCDREPFRKNHEGKVNTNQ